MPSYASKLSPLLTDRGRAVLAQHTGEQLEASPVLTIVKPTLTLGVSVTGAHCSLQCKHCCGHFLKAMTPISTLEKNTVNGYSSLLISGGCQLDGTVPLAGHKAKLLQLGNIMPLNFHVGLQRQGKLDFIDTETSVISLDLIGDDSTIKEVMGLKATWSDYKKTYQSLRSAFQVIPHLILGLHCGNFVGEDTVLQLLQNEPPAALVLLVLRPTPQTPFADVAPPPLAEVVSFIKRCVQTLPCPVHLGCMRPSGTYRQDLDVLALASGIRSIVMPHKNVRSAAKIFNIEVQSFSECCAFLPFQASQGLSHG